MVHYFKTKIILLCYILVVGACNTSTNVELPDGILSETEMIEIITDIQLLEAAHKSLPSSAKKQQNMKDTSYSIIYSKNKTSHTEFDSSMKVYSRYPELMGEILEGVAENINKRK